MSATEAAMSESDYLAREAARAKTAFVRALTGAKIDLGRGIDPRAWTEQHPWISLAAASVAGFVTATALVPSKEQQVLKKLATLEKSLGDATRRATGADDHDGKASAGIGGMLGGTLGVIGRTVFKAVGPALTSALSAAFAAHAVQPENGAEVDPNAAPETSPETAGRWDDPSANL